jgi:hypothetical protein
MHRETDRQSQGEGETNRKIERDKYRVGRKKQRKEIISKKRIQR